MMSEGLFLEVDGLVLHLTTKEQQTYTQYLLAPVQGTHWSAHLVATLSNRHQSTCEVAAFYH